MPKTVTAGRTSSRRVGWREAKPSLYASDGRRKYINRQERQRVEAAMRKLDPERSLFALLLLWTGARVSEVLALTPRSFQVDANIVSLVTLKQRRACVREVPIPPALMAALSRRFALRRAQACETRSGLRLWRFCRVTAWRMIKKVMARAAVSGKQACPRGLRHGFGTGTLQSGVPLNIIQRWMGHARMSTTAIYADVCGLEEIVLAQRFWNGTEIVPRT